jgi:hypothetical protein
MNPRYWELNGGRPTVEGMLTKMQEREDAVTGTLLARIDPDIARLVVNLKAASQMARQYLSEVAESFENEKATSTHLEELNVALVRQAILTVLDESNPRTPGLAWNFDDDEQRVDFADQVVSWLAVRATPSAIEPRSGPYTHPNDDPPGVDFEGRKYERRS